MSDFFNSVGGFAEFLRIGGNFFAAEVRGESGLRSLHIGDFCFEGA